FNFNKTNNYSKTYTYNSKTTIFYRVIEVVDWECIQSGKSIKECTSLVRRYQMKENEVMIEDKETVEMFEMMIEDKETID
ncbi:MAG: hypothetical protein VX762_00185, partial [Bacteroidota bacterium]|nr:hypothetical protein [Bacteroidota bacterium]